MAHVNIDEKLNILLNSEHGETLRKIINSLYRESIYPNDISTILLLLNDILSEINYEKIDYIDKFVVIYGDIIQIDNDKFIERNIANFAKLNIDYTKELFYKNKKRNNRDILKIVSHLILNTGYAFEGYFGASVINGTSKKITKYRIVKIYR
jgi:hypothetical protein